MLKSMLTFALMLFPLSFAIAGEDEGLYPDAPPADAGFVRVINHGDDMRNDMTLSGISLGEVAQKSVTDYAVLKQGDVSLEIGDVSMAHAISAGEYYTVASLNDDIIFIEDHKIDDPTKAVIALYNLSDIANISLISTTHNADVFKDVASGTKDARSINAVSLGIAIKNGDQIVSEMTGVKLERQIATSLFVTGNNGTYDVIVKKSENLK